MDISYCGDIRPVFPDPVTYMIGRIIAAAFQLCFMALTVNVISRHGPSNEMRPQLQPKKTKGRLH